MPQNPPAPIGSNLPQAGGAMPLFSSGQNAPGVAPNAGGSNVLQMLALMQALQQGGMGRGPVPQRGGLNNLFGGKGGTAPTDGTSVPAAPSLRGPGGGMIG